MLILFEVVKDENHIVNRSSDQITKSTTILVEGSEILDILRTTSMICVNWFYYSNEQLIKLYESKLLLIILTFVAMVIILMNN